jgi:hypothetical protein
MQLFALSAEEPTQTAFLKNVLAAFKRGWHDRYLVIDLVCKFLRVWSTRLCKIGNL